MNNGLFSMVKLSAVAESRDEADDNQGSSTAILKLALDDEVWIVHESGNNEVFGSPTDRQTSFTGTLLYEVKM